MRTLLSADPTQMYADSAIKVAWHAQFLESLIRLHTKTQKGESDMQNAGIC